MDYIKKKFVDKEDRFISFFSTDDNIICSNGKTLRDNMEMINNPSEEVCDINYISPESLDEFIELTKEGGLFYCLTNIPIVYNEKNYDVVGLIDVRPHSNGINYYAYNKMWQFLINPDTKALVSFSSFAEFLQKKIPSDASKLNIIDVNDNFTSENVEGALEELTTQVEENQINLLEDETSMEGINDTEYPTLTTQNKTLIGSINEVNTQIENLAEVAKSKNVFDKSKIINGKYYNVYENNGRIWNSDLLDNSILFVTGLIPVSENDVIRSNKNWINMVYYMKDGTNKANDNLTNFGNLNKNEITIMSTSGKEIKYVACTFRVSDLDTIMITINNEVPVNYIPFFEPIFSIKKSALVPLINSLLITKEDISLNDKWVRKDIHINLTDTQEDILVKMLNAIKRGNCDVYFESGTYNFDTVFDLMKTKYEYTTAYELPIGGNCRYYFNGSTLIATKTSTDTNVIGNESLMGSRRNGGNYELYDGILIANDMVYCVHDEAQGSLIPYVRKYKNMRMKYNTISSTQEFRKCIGGGAGQKGTIIIENCVFECDTLAEVAYHGFQSNEVNTELNLTVSNCYFKHKLQFDSMYSNGKGVALICGNSYASEPIVGTNWEIYKVNNEIRTDI